VALVTRATSGLGEAAAAGFARLGATVWLLARDRERADQPKARISERTGNDAPVRGPIDQVLPHLRQLAREADAAQRQVH
jgi:short-subunit dehydrogenase